MRLKINLKGGFYMLLAVFLNSIRLLDVKVFLICYDRPYGEPLEVVKFNLDEYDLDASPYKFMQVFAFDLCPAVDGYNLEVKIYKD
ncbi:MAG: hypothetical protein QXI16_04960, partial [Sulfolobaceae archaeon]